MPAGALLAALKFRFKTCIAMNFVDDDDDAPMAVCHVKTLGQLMF